VTESARRTVVVQAVITTIGNGSVPIQLAQCWFRGLAISSGRILIYLSNKIYGSNVANSTRKVLWFEMTKMLIAVLKKQTYCVIYYNF